MRATEFIKEYELTPAHVAPKPVTEDEQINEIGAIDYLIPLNLTAEIIKSATKTGNIENQDVWTVNDEKCDLYFFKDELDNLEAFILIETKPSVTGYYRYHRMENKTSKPGRVTALISFVVAKLDKKLYISNVEELTRPGRDWLLKLISQPRYGLSITDQNGDQVDVGSLEIELRKAYVTEIPGPTEIYIECKSSQYIKNRITEQTGFMMPYLSYFMKSELI